MSRIGKKPVSIPSGVTVQVASGKVQVQGPKGKLEFPLYQGIGVKVEGGNAVIEKKGDNRQVRAWHGLTRASIANMVAGVTQGYEKKLEIVGVGWNAKIQGKELQLQVGYCHPVVFPIPEGVTVACPQPTFIVMQSADRQKLGQFAAEVRSARPPEPYNGKGIKYDKEVIRRKAGKSFAATAS